MLVAATLAVIAAMTLMLTRTFMGPTLYDRILAVNSFGTKTVLALGRLATNKGYEMWKPSKLSHTQCPWCFQFHSVTANHLL